MNTTNHKGTWCVLNPSKLCQEGFCSECWLYVKWNKELEEVRKKL
jgi:hypothetical protein